MDSWYEVLTACDPSLNAVQSITAIAFDPYQELLWTGNDKVIVDIFQNLSNEDTSNLHCMAYTTIPNPEILAAGKQNNMLVINVARGSVVKKVESANEIVVMRKSRLVCCGATSGEVILRDPNTFRVEHRIRAHTGTISDIDTSGNLLLTCGFSVSYINAFDLSTSGEMLAFGDSASIVHLWSDRKGSKINAYSSNVELPAVPSPTPNVFIGENDPLSLIGMPYYREPLLSVWPSNMMFEVGNPPPKIDPDIMNNMKMIDFVGYAPNIGNKKRNQTVRWSKKKHKAGTPKFHSEKERELQSGKESKEPVNLFDEEAELGAIGTRMPKYYKRVEIKYSRFGIDDFDFEFYNKTRYAGLETHITNSYCNSLLQVLFFTPALCLITKSHIGSSCSKENCLCCELGFLFRMLEDAVGRNCQASNFLKAFSTIPQALDLFEPDKPDEKSPYSMLIQNFNRFILEQLHQECNSDNNPRLLKSLPLEKTSLSVIQQLIGMQMISVNKCQCEAETERNITSFVVDLNYSIKDKHTAPKSFVDILRSSIRRETQPKAWCNNCQQYTPIIAKKIPKSLPPVLTINCGLGTSVPLDYWRSLDKNKTWISMRLEQDDLIVKELASDAVVDTSYTGNLDSANYEIMAIIAQIRIEKETPHLVVFIKVPNKELEPGSKGPWYLFNDFLVRNVTEQEVFNFQGLWKTPVVLYYSRIDITDLIDISALPSEIDKSILFKDISISKLVVLNFFLKCKWYTILNLIKLLFIRHRLTNKKTAHLLTPEELPQPGTLVAIDAEFVVLNQETEIRSDGTKSVIRPSRLSLARVSVLRGEGPKESIPFIDDYIATSEPVVDYLTEFSGIEGLTSKLLKFHKLLASLELKSIRSFDQSNFDLHKREQRIKILNSDIPIMSNDVNSDNNPPSLLKEIGYDTIDILDPAVDTTGTICDVINLSSTVAVPFSRFLPIVDDVVKIFDEIAKLYQSAEHNRRICGTLFDRVIAAEAAIRTLKIRRDEHKEFFNQQNFVVMQKFLRNIENIKKFINDVSQLKGLSKYIQAKSIETTFQELTTEFDRFVSILNLTITIDTRDRARKDKEILRKDIEDLNKVVSIMCLTDVNKNVSDSVNQLNLLKDMMAQLMAEKENKNNNTQNQQIINSLFEDTSIRFCEFEETTEIRGSKVRKYIRLKDREEVALKLVANEKNSDNDRENIRNQVIILKKLKDCQQILQFYGLTSDGDKTYLVTEWAELRNLKEYYTAYKPIGVKKKLRIAIDIARGLNFLRAVDIIHRDIRSENILITHHETAKIANFYLSRHFYDDTKNLEATQDTAVDLDPNFRPTLPLMFTTLHKLHNAICLPLIPPNLCDNINPPEGGDLPDQNLDDELTLPVINFAEFNYMTIEEASKIHRIPDAGVLPPLQKTWNKTVKSNDTDPDP
ncbi:17986_t:CDS:10 [Racocetra fulgida]|uniref:17986_t:CDS:1 n=1 Tax=Racocetra fulgida TaxID=60492 RepID=A0A9N8W077_9GLOM|nr:17986_t:CDS:10 [Racocetra fulgida]